jgi:hypothetical protein
MGEIAQVRRLRPTDRRSPRGIPPGQCPGGERCYCCPKSTVRGHGRRDGDCPLRHPEVERLCSPPYPSNVWPCPERRALPQDPPHALTGRDTPRYEVCVECGRITTRRWTNPDGVELAWCAGTMPPPEPRAAGSRA